MAEPEQGSSTPTRYQLKMWTAHAGSNDAAWNAQIEVMKKIGAQFDDGCWWLIIDSDLSSRARDLAELFAASRDYGTGIEIARLQL